MESGHLRFLRHPEKSNDLFNKTREKHDTIPKAFSTFQSIVVLIVINVVRFVILHTLT